MVFLRSRLISSLSILKYLGYARPLIYTILHPYRTHPPSSIQWMGCFTVLLGKLAGFFSSPRIYPEDEGRLYLRISSTRFLTKTDQLSSLVIHVRTVVESLQK
ncbi:hypothetical protein CEXT_385551 [Caerostris extrusa]|uniref:Uncharacterized protein n=1 Tax=Caerostris extrusa TaxID=172846 RepID=A0AAV4RI76_CAEEX|nr:hypothetical protein CEXT_385551 [Caerostris extrusa]